MYMNQVTFHINKLVESTSGCQKCKAHRSGLFVYISNHDQDKCLLNLTRETKVKRFFSAAYKRINQEKVKDVLRQRIQE